jgi:Fe-S-cluster containining protein
LRFVPWRYITDWKCTECGDCCRLYSVVLNFREWLTIVKNYGVEQTVPTLSKLFLRRRLDGSCAFLYNLPNTCACGLQFMKPKACQLWPFKILGQPRFGYVGEAAYRYGGTSLYVYVDPMCRGLSYGTPTWEFASLILKEFTEIAMGLRDNQCKTTANTGLPISNLRSTNWRLAL